MVQQVVAVVLGVAWLAGACLLSAQEDGRNEALAWTMGGVFGFVLQRSRFCFFCNVRDFVERREGGGVLAILVALAVGVVGYHVVTGAWIVDASAGHLPPKAHISPIGWHLVAGGLVFGLGMAVSGSCISAHLYRIGEGSVVCLLALAGLVPGFALGYVFWNPVYLSLIAGKPAVWLPAHLGFVGALVLQLGVLAAVAYGVWRWSRSAERAGVLEKSLSALAGAVFVRRWPGWVGGVVVGLISTVVLLRLDPLGVTSEFSRLARWAGDAAGVLPARLEGLDAIRGCSARPTEGVISRSGFFLLSLVLAAAVAALGSREFALEWPRPKAAVGALIGGGLLGLGAAWSFGCTIGTFLSGIHASALSGWIFGAALVVGILAGLPIRRRIVS